MNREIKFRGKRIDNGKWAYGYVRLQPKTGRTIIEWLGEDDMLTFCVVDPETVGQFTGLRDDNGKEIYEGDIINFGAQLGSKNEVKFLEINAGFLVKDKYGDWKWLYDIVGSTNCKIIGNIFEEK